MVIILGASRSGSISHRRWPKGKRLRERMPVGRNERSIMMVLRAILLSLSLLGFFLYFHIYRGIKPAMLPAIVFSLITVVTFISGILNMLLITTWLLLVLGVILLVVCVQKVIRDKMLSTLRVFFLDYSIWFLLICSAYYAFAFKGRFLSSYDDFSHWGLVTRTILNTNMFPNFSIPSTQIFFSSYPLGSASFIYFFCRSIGVSGGSYYLFAQALLTMGYLVSVFCCVEKHKGLGFAVVSLFLAVLFTHNITPYSLCVDRLLASAGIAGMVFCLQYRDRIAAGDLLPETSLLLCAVVTYKNSGVFFAFIIAFALLLFYRRSKAKPHTTALLLALAVPFILVFIWQRHADYVFNDGLLAKHSMSFSYYKALFANNGPSGRSSTFRIVFPLLINPMKNYAIFLWVGFVLLFIATRYYAPDKATDCKKVLLIMSVALVVYTAGALFMYLFSMPASEVRFSQGKDYSRYNGTLVAFMCGVLIYEILYITNEIALKKSLILIIAGLGLSFSILRTNTFLSFYDPQAKFADVDTSCASLHHMMDNNAIGIASDYVILFGSPDNAGYHYYLTNYYLLPNSVELCYDAVSAEKAWETGNYRYFLDLQNGISRER